MRRLNARSSTDPKPALLRSPNSWSACQPETVQAVYDPILITIAPKLGSVAPPFARGDSHDLLEGTLKRSL